MENNQEAYVTVEKKVHRNKSQNSLKKTSKKKMWIIILCTLLALILIAGILVYIFVFNSPVLKIYQAALNTKARLDEILQNGENLSDWVDSVKEVYDSGRFTLDVDYEMPEKRLDMSLNYHSEQSALAGALSYQIDAERTLEADFSANEDELMFRFPQLLNKTFSVPLEDLGDQVANNSYFSEYLPDWVQALDGLDPDLFTDISWEAYHDAHEDEIEELIDSVEVDEIDKQIEHARGLTTYRMTLDTPLFTELFLGYLHYAHETRLGEGRTSSLSKTIDWFEELLLDKELTFYVGIDDNDCLSAFHLDAQGEQTSTMTVVLNGKGNLWNSFGIWIDGEEKYSGGLKAESSGFELQINQYTLRSMDDQRIVRLMRDTKTLLSMQYQTEGERNGTTIQYGEKNLTLGIAPYKKTVNMLSNDPIDLLDMGFLDWLEIIAILVEENLL